MSQDENFKFYVKDIKRSQEKTFDNLYSYQLTVHEPKYWYFLFDIFIKILDDTSKEHIFKIYQEKNYRDSTLFQS